MSDRSEDDPDLRPPARATPATPRASSETRHARLARRALLAFVLTFVASRSIVFLIMSQRIPDLYFFLRGVHVHHLNYGIFLLAAVGAYTLLGAPDGRRAAIAANAYGIAMALTFDEFGMWLHLGGSYWQRASIDAVIVVSCLLALLAYSGAWRDYARRRRKSAWIALVAVVAFALVLWDTGNRIGHLYGPHLEQLEADSSR